MTKFTGFTLWTLTFSLTAAANTGASNYEGIYAVEQCNVGSIKSYDKARIVLTGEQLAIYGFKAESSSRDDATELKLTNGKKTKNAGGVTSWKIKTGSNFLEYTENFDRNGDSTYPDLNSELIVRLELDESSKQVSITRNYKNIHAGRRSETSESCRLVSLSSDKNQVNPASLKKLSLSKLESLVAQQTKLKDLSFDQANVHAARATLNLTKPNLESLKEALQIELLPTSSDSIEVKALSVTQQNAREVSRSAFATALGIANDYIKDGNSTQEEYKAFFAYLYKVEETLKSLPAGVRVYEVKWGNSDQADGEGLLLLDSNSGEALFIGSAYFG